jgi:acetoin utilization deacetylase AcuC-like enzyme
MTLLFTDPLFLRHQTGRHPERPARLEAVVERLEQAGLLGRCSRGTCAPCDPEPLTALHAPEQVAGIRQLAEQGGGYVDPDTVVSPESFQVALTAVGACQAAVDAVLSGAHQNALCLVRPPGHHATPTRSMGFCLFNNIALAAHHARAAHGVNRLLIVDWDVHHGNGTQDIFYEDPGVLYLSIHRYGFGFYPGTGAAEETGSGPGAGTTRNVALSQGTSRARYRAAFSQALEQVGQFQPELVLISAGFDADARDPIGGLGLEAEDFQEMTRQVLEVARVHAHSRLVSCLEGGYDLNALAEGVEAHLQELLDEASRT